MIREVRIDTIEELLHAFNSLPNRYAYRGHASADWKLQSTLQRACGARFEDDFVAQQERYCLSEFRSKFHLYDTQNARPESKLEWLALMQHYGVPTRMLDFTLSPFVALYFAHETHTPAPDANLAVYAVDHDAMMKVSFDYLGKLDRKFQDDNVSMSLDGRQDKVFDETVDRFAHPILWMTEPAKLNVRIDRQAGCFLLTGQRLLSVEDALAQDLYAAVDARKYVIPSTLFMSIFALLRKMNISATTVYGDLSGLAGSLRAQIRVYCLP